MARASGAGGVEDRCGACIVSAGQVGLNLNSNLLNFLPASQLSKLPSMNLATNVAR